MYLNALGLITGAAKSKWQGCSVKISWLFYVGFTDYMLFILLFVHVETFDYQDKVWSG